MAFEIKRYSVDTKNKMLKNNTDGSLTIYLQADAPTGELQRAILAWDSFFHLNHDDQR